MQKPIHFATVVTDLTTCHNAWFHRGVSRCFVPTAGTLLLAIPVSFGIWFFCLGLSCRSGCSAGPEGPSTLNPKP